MIVEQPSRWAEPCRTVARLYAALLGDAYRALLQEELPGSMSALVVRLTSAEARLWDGSSCGYVPAGAAHR
jgi:hypothetical protein